MDTTLPLILKVYIQRYLVIKYLLMIMTNGLKIISARKFPGLQYIETKNGIEISIQ